MATKFKVGGRARIVQIDSMPSDMRAELKIGDMLLIEKVNESARGDEDSTLICRRCRESKQWTLLFNEAVPAPASKEIKKMPKFFARNGDKARVY